MLLKKKYKEVKKRTKKLIVFKNKLPAKKHLTKDVQVTVR